MTDEELKFENLFKVHLAEWPKVISLKLHSQECIRVEPTNEGYDLVTYQDIPWTGEKTCYVVNELYEVMESIEGKYIGHKHEIIRRHMVDAFYSIIKDIAYYLNSVDLTKIRVESVKQYFEYKLQGLKDEGWKDQLPLAKRYFEVNGVPIRKRKSKTEK